LEGSPPLQVTLRQQVHARSPCASVSPSWDVSPATTHTQQGWSGRRQRPHIPHWMGGVGRDPLTSGACSAGPETSVIMRLSVTSVSPNSVVSPCRQRGTVQLDVLEGFVAPCVPPQTLAAGEHLEVRTGGHLLDEIQEGVRLPRVPALAGPLEPRAPDLRLGATDAPAGEEDVLRAGCGRCRRVHRW
jgi:hypothetical protein